MKQVGRFHWWQAVLVFVIANLVSGLPVGLLGDERFYNAQVKPAIAPPDFVFAPVWLVLNITSLIALYRVANAPQFTSRHRRVVLLEAVGWIVFATFTSLYFGLQSPILGAVDTVVGLGVAIASFLLCITLDRLAAAFILLRVLWLTLASYVAVYVALHNPDPFFSNLAVTADGFEIAAAMANMNFYSSAYLL